MAERIVMELKTGPVTIALKPDLAPGHVARIKELASKGFYDGIVFHRVIPGFMAQTGDPTGTGSGGSDLPNLQAEFSPANHVRGTCSMARSSSPNSANSQFFICFGDAPWLEQAIYGLGSGGRRHGACRCHQEGRRTQQRRDLRRARQDYQDERGCGRVIKFPPPLAGGGAEQSDAGEGFVRDAPLPRMFFALTLSLRTQNIRPLPQGEGDANCFVISVYSIPPAPNSHHTHT